MKKRLLFVIPSLDAGGAEKSLVNLLNTIDLNRYEVDLFTFKEKGFFDDLVPTTVNRISLPKNLIKFQKGLFRSVISFLFSFQLQLALYRIRYAINIFTIKNTGITEQQNWKYLQKAIGKLPNQYDAAIGFLEKSSIYCVVDCVVSNKKIGFIHTNYSKLEINQSFDFLFFKKLSCIFTISEECVASLKGHFKELDRKIILMYNIVSTKLILEMSNSNVLKIDDKEVLNLLTIARLSIEKNIELNIEIAKLLKEKGLKFKWYIIGEGSLKELLEQKIDEYKLQNNFQFLGLISNPYPYIQNADIYLQLSLYEGKSIAIDEAKILQKPIIVTNFSTAKDQIEHNVSGIICDFNAEEIATEILKLKNNTNKREELKFNLAQQNLSTEAEIEKLYQAIE